MSATNFAYGLIYNLALPSVQFKLILTAPITTAAAKKKQKTTTKKKKKKKKKNTRT